MREEQCRYHEFKSHRRPLFQKNIISCSLRVENKCFNVGKEKLKTINKIILTRCRLQPTHIILLQWLYSYYNVNIHVISLLCFCVNHFVLARFYTLTEQWNGNIISFLNMLSTEGKSTSFTFRVLELLSTRTGLKIPKAWS